MSFNLHVPRALQLDSKQLDDEFNSLLITKLTNALSFLQKAYLVKLEPELHTLLKVFLHNFVLREKRQTVGQTLLDLKYDSNVSTKKLHLYSICLIFFSWIQMRQSSLVNFISPESIKDKVKIIIGYLEVYVQSLELLNLIIFVIEGHYPTVLERLFKIKMVPKIMDRRIVTYNYFTRELLWNGFSDLLSFVLPLITFDQFHSFIKMLLPSQGRILDTQTLSDIKLDEIDANCVSCKESAILPQLHGCSHIACYYCVHAAIASAGVFQCTLCGTEVFSTDKVVDLSKKLCIVD